MNEFELLDINIENLIRLAEDEAIRFNKEGIKANQIRNFYSAIDQMRTTFRQHTSKSGEGREGFDKIRHDFIMLKPKLAYAAGRKKEIKQYFYPFMKAAIEAVERADENRKDLAMTNYFSLIESVVGYHKYYGDK